MLLNGGSLGVLAAAATYLSIYCYLRPSEAMSLVKSDVTLPRKGHPDFVHTIAPSGQDRQPAKHRQFDDSVIIGLDNRVWARDLVKKLWLTVGSNKRLCRDLTLA